MAPTTASVPASIKAQPGFEVKLVYAVPLETQGSWVSLAVDGKDRLLASPQGSPELYRITLPQDASNEVKVEPFGLGIGHAHSLLEAFGSLYVVVADAPKDARYTNGVYRLFDTDADDRYDLVEKLIDIRGGGEHGPHGLVVSPDGKSITFTASNFTPLPEAVTKFRAPKVWGQDNLLPPIKDPLGDKGKFRPGGWVVKFRLMAKTGNWWPQACATPTTLLTTMRAICSPTIPIWSGIWARRGTGRPAS